MHYFWPDKSQKHPEPAGARWSVALAYLYKVTPHLFCDLFSGCSEEVRRLVGLDKSLQTLSRVQSILWIGVVDADDVH